MRRCFILVVIVAGLVLGACNAALPEPTVEPGPPQMLSLVDAQGRTVALGQFPPRITIAGRSGLTIADTLFMFPEAQERVVGVVTGRQNVGDFLVYVDPDFEGITQLDVEAGPEQIATTNPDLVVLKNVVSNELGASLEQIGIPVLYVDLETPDQYRRDLALMGQLLGDERRAVEVWSFYQARLDRVAEALNGLAEGDKPSVLVAQYNEEGGEVALSVPPAAWLQTIEVELAGGRPVWKDAATGGGWQVVNLEQIAAWNPDHIMIISYGEDSSAVVQQLREDAQWQGLAALQADQIYGFPGDIFSWAQPDPRWILGFTWLAGRIHPELFPDLDVMAEVDGFFGELYGMDAQAIEAYIVPALTGNVSGQ
jgi:iron complex transport system substrate-binding protein